LRRSRDSSVSTRSIAPAVLALVLCAPAFAGGVPGVEPIEAPGLIETIEVQGRAAGRVPARSATEGYVTAEQLAQRPVARAGELLEFVPGLIVTQHSGEGKANQYFLRGFNLDHGTDFYSEVDGVPVNMRTHGHGQGYADINFIIPELIGTLAYRKGPYYADTGDFSAAGSADLRYVDALDQPMLRLTGGEHGYASALAAGSPRLGDGHLLLGLQATRYDGPFTREQDIRKTAGLMRYNQGNARQGLTLSVSTYDIDYRAPDQIPERAVERGLIGAEGVIDPSDGGNVGRYSASLDWRGVSQDEHSRWRTQAYALRYRMQLFSNFTYFLSDPTDADTLPDDQFNQFDDRWTYGGSSRRAWELHTRIPTTLELGTQARHDEIDTVALRLTQQRRPRGGGIAGDGVVRSDRVRESSLAVFASATQQWAPWLRSVIGARLDGYTFDVDGNLPANSGSRKDHIFSPKLTLVFGPFSDTLLFANYGEGFHSNDARGATLRVDPLDGSTPQQRVDALVKARGGEIGLTREVTPALKISSSIWTLDFDSELVFVGDAGGSEASGASRRRGVELSAYYAPQPWLVLDADYAYAHARLDSEAGNRVPNSVEDVFSLGITVPDVRGWSGGLRLRRMGAGPLVEDNSARSRPTTVVNGQAGYRWPQGYSASLQVLNLLDSQDNDITYYYASRLPGEPAEGVLDHHFHRIEQRQVRLTVGVTF
jgi:outer membrane receptor protein involved in Fe transport